MGKLVSLLKEKISTDNIINLNDVKKETSMGVLYRLMLAINNDHNFYNEVNTKSFVNKNLGNLEDKQTVKNLNMIFNKISALLKDNKKITVEMKKAYYTHVFTLLLPMTGKENKFKFGTMVNGFSSNKPEAAIFQRNSAVLIGKALIHANKDIIDPDDKFTIQAYINGLEEIAASDETTTIAVTLDEKISKMSTEEIIAAHTKLENNQNINKSITKVVSISDDIERIKNELDDKLVDAHTFSRIKMDQIESPKEVENKIIEIADRIVDTITKLPIPHLPEDKIKRIQKLSAMIVSDTMSVMVKHVPDIIGNDTTPIVSYNSDNNSVVIGFENPKGLRFLREFKMDKNGDITEVYHDYFELPESAQGTGISKDAMLGMLKTYKAAGIKKVSLHANLGLGGYVFLRYGFLPDDKSGNDIKDAFKGLKVGIENGLNPNKQSLGTTADKSLQALVNHFNQPNLGSIIQLAVHGYSDIQKEVKKLWDAVGYDPTDPYSGTDNPVVMPTVSEYVAEIFQTLIADVEKQFVINYETLDTDIATKEITATLSIPELKPTVGKLNYRFDNVKALFTKNVANIKKNMSTGSITMKVLVKTILTIPGIIQTNDKGQMVNAFPPVETEVNGDYLVSALNWKGSLDLTNETQYNKAIAYASFTK